MGSSIEGRFPYLDCPRRRARGRASRPAAAARARGEVRPAASGCAGAPALRSTRCRRRPYRAPIRDVFAGANAPEYVARAARAEAARRGGAARPAAVARLRAKLGSSNGRGRQRDGRDGPRRLAVPDARPRPVRREPAARASPRADASRGRRTRRDVGHARHSGRLMGWSPPQLLVQDSLSAAAQASPTRTGRRRRARRVDLRRALRSRAPLRARPPGQRPRARRSRRAVSSTTRRRARRRSSGRCSPAASSSS